MSKKRRRRHLMYVDESWKPILATQDLESAVVNRDGEVIAEGLTQTQARLIAAAPDLLDSVWDMVVCLEELKLHPDGVARARAVIAKVEGK